MNLEYCFFTKYNSDGKITETGQCPVSDLALQSFPDGGGILKGLYDSNSYYVKNGEIQEYTEDQKKELGSKERAFIRFDVSSGNFQDVRSINELILLKVEYLKAQRDLSLQRGEVKPFQGIEVTVKADAQTISALASSKDNIDTSPLSWRFPGGIWLDLSKEELEILLGWAKDISRKNFEKLRLLEAKALAATTIEQLDAITWN